MDSNEPDATADKTSASTADDKSATDLDALLEEALEDFNKPPPPKRRVESATSLPDSGTNTSAWTDEFIRQATQNFETTMKQILDQQPSQKETANSSDDAQKIDLSEMSAEFTKFAEAAAKAATDGTNENDFAQCLSETLNQISKNKEAAQAVPSAEELENIFGQLGLGDRTGSGSGEDDIGGFFPLMQTMLENILSKEVLYHPMQEIVSKYPEWLADNRCKLSEADFDRYNKQYTVMREVIEKFESEKDNDSEEVKAQNFEAVLKLMQRLQEYGQPPPDLVGDQMPVLNFDEKGNPQLPDLSSLFGAVGFPNFGAPATQDETTCSASDSHDANEYPPVQQTNEQCSIM